MPVMSLPVVVTVPPLAVPPVNVAHWISTWLQVEFTGKVTLGPAQVPVVQVPPPNPVVSGVEVPAVTRASVAVPPGTVPFTQNESPA